MTLQEHRLLREASQLLTFAEKMKTAKPKITPKASQPLANATLLLTRNVKEFLTTRYDFRYNLLTDETEFRHAGQRAAPFIPIGKRELNALCIEAHDEGIPCWDKDLSRYVYSSYIRFLSPFSSLYGRVARLGWSRQTDRTCPTCFLSSVVGTRFSHMDVGACFAVDEPVRTSCQQRSAYPCQPGAGAPEEHLLSLANA